MIKVFLVEDEIIVRNGIKNQINWKEEGLEFVGEASDGELALPMIQQLKPDIIITDIKMPFMDGLQFSKLAKKEIPEIKIIILSGYDEFQYAKEAIKIGVTDYLLKPIAGEELLRAVLGVSNIIYEERHKKEALELAKMELAEKEKITYQQFFSDIVTNKMPVQEMLEKSKDINIDLVAREYNILLCKLFERNNGSSAYWTEAGTRNEEIMDRIRQSRNIICFDRANEGIAILIKGQNQEELVAESQKAINCINEFSQMNNLDYFIGVGNEVQRLSELYKSFDGASKAFAYQYILERNQAIYCENLTAYRVVRDKKINIKDIDVNKTDSSVITSFLKTGSRNEIRHFLEEYFFNIGENNLKSFLFCQYIILSMYFSCISFVEKLGYAYSDIVDKCGDMLNMNSYDITLKEIIDYFDKVINTVVDYREKNSTKKYSGILNLAKEYIDENYASDDISLNSVASKVHVSTSYFSTIFRQEMGCNFVDYLSGIRMGKAKELLRCSSMKSSEVGYAVGYKDPHYFSFLFRKTQGCTPKEYRMKGKE
ncbi:MAG TPA: response regulator [Ruminiclostridium sp.]|nr:response regulator [Ruminiclostridium sp.]